MSQLHQMQMSYVGEEDRVLWRINTTDGVEVRFWVTRRYLALLWRVLSDIKAQADQSRRQGRMAPPATPAPGGEPPGGSVTGSQPSGYGPSLIPEPDFTTAYEEAGKLPLGENPVLLVHVGVRAGLQQQVLLCVQPEGKAGIEIALNERILTALCALILHTEAKVGWNLNLPGASGPGIAMPPINPGLN
jgi:hypothetical protein